MWTAHDCGTVINPMAVEGQLEGSIQMGLGYALSEQFVMNGRPAPSTPPSSTTRCPRRWTCRRASRPPSTTYEPEGPFGAKEAGEGLVSPTAPAIADAVYHATGYRCMDLPITPEKVLAGLEDTAAETTEEAS